MALQSYKDVQNFLNKVMKDNQQYERVFLAPHLDFWNHLTYAQFTNGIMPNLKIPVSILVIGNSAESNLILSLKGTGPMFNPQTGKPGPMPPGGPMFTEDQIQELADWIDTGCPEFEQS